MSKKLFSFIFIFGALFMGALYYGDTIQAPIIASLNYLKSNYHNSIEFIENEINKHTFQAQKIALLEKNLKKYENNHLVMQQLASEVNDLLKENNSTLKTNPEVELVRTLSYEEFGDLNRVWLDVKDYDPSKIYGLTHNELVAGIVVPKNGKPLGLLNKDVKSSYAVFVGENLAPGIAHGNNSEFLVVKFIPAWFNIKKGDEVISSGLDNIFIKGLKVGKVLSVTKSQGYQDAVIQQYYGGNDPNYFHMIRSVR
ncbi:MAG: rod shape-determining protein MreC [Campylobacterales bacterium]|nr:rod shape-determining protein MreC [Campylobacterales bacterium]